MLRPGRGGSLPAYGGAPSPYSNGSQSSHGSQQDYYSNGNENGYSTPAPSDPAGGAAYGGFSAVGNGNSEFKDKPRKQSSGLPSFLKNPAILAGVLALIFLFTTMRYRGQINSILKDFRVKTVKEAISVFHKTRTEKIRAERDLKHHVEDLHHQEQHHDEHHHDDHEYTRLEHELHEVRKDRDELRVKYEHAEDHHDAHETELHHLSKRDMAWKEQTERLQKAVGKEAHRVALERYGKGPHHVEMYVWLPNEGEEKSFTIEMAPLDLMPHSVLHFLEQVDHGLWDSAWFYLNGPHVLQAGPQADEDEEDYSHHHEDDREFALKRFRELELEHLIYPEYNEHYPHTQWTLGFTGRPGGPDFYLNKVDNSVQHGPGGQNHHELEEQADPCFAKVISGFDVLNKLFQLPTVVGDNKAWEFFYKDPVHITGAVLLDPKPVEEHHEHHVHTKHEEDLHHPHHKRQHPHIEDVVDA